MELLVGKDKIKIEGYIGTWHIIETSWFHCMKVALLEHDKYGDETPCLIVNEHLDIIMDEVYNGFSDMWEEN
jgi:hypothetical protein